MLTEVQMNKVKNKKDIVPEKGIVPEVEKLNEDELENEVLMGKKK